MSRKVKSSAGRILVVDDEPDMRSGLRAILKRQKFQVVDAGTVEEALKILAGEPVDLVLTDLMLPGGTGIDLLEKIREDYPDTLVILFTGFATVETAVEAIRKGAFDYIPKPFSPNQLEVAVRRAFKQQELSNENKALRGQINDRFSYDKLIGVSHSMKKVYDLLRRVSPTNASILIIGESGTGKELIARAIHANSKRQSRPFQPLDCAALPQNLLESELFGYEKGAFTGANSARKGLLASADGGTFFMDELGELDLSMQVKFLRVLQERKFRRLGGQEIIEVDVRVVAATNRDLEKEVAAGNFREDLFHRLNVIQVRLPPLRERHGDIPVLAKHFLDGFASQFERGRLKLTPEALSVLEAHRWPGNVRELQNAMEYAASLCESEEIGPQDLPVSVRESAQKEAGKPTGACTDAGQPGTLLYELVYNHTPYKLAKRRWLEVFEQAYIMELLRRHDNNISQAAQKAGIDRKSIQRILKKNDLQVQRDN